MTEGLHERIKNADSRRKDPHPEQRGSPHEVGVRDTVEVREPTGEP